MTNAVQKAMDEWGIKFLRERGHKVADDASISFEDDIQYGGYCETCSYEDYVVRVSDGKVMETYYGSMGEIIRAMI